MKFFAYVALVCGASALSLNQMSAGLVQEEMMNLQLSAFDLKKGPKKDDDDEKDEVMDDFKAAIEAELAKDGDVTLDELFAIVEKLAKKYEFKLPKGWKKHVEKMFDYVDANDDGKVTGPEIEAAMKKHDKEEDEDKDLETADIGDDFKAAIKAELDKDGSVTLKELYGIIKSIAKKYKFKLPKGWTKHVKKIFDYVDANDDGKVTGPEIEAAMKKHDKEEDEDKDLETADPGDDFKAAIKAELDKDGSVTLKELYGIIKSIAKKYKFKLPKGWTKHVKKIFDYVDANDDGKVTGPEIDAAMKKHDKEEKEVELDDEDVGDDFEKAIKHELDKDGNVDLEELYAIFEKLAKEYKFKLPKGWKGYVKKIFDYVDANNDGKVTGPEIEAAMAKHEKK